MVAGAMALLTVMAATTAWTGVVAGVAALVVVCLWLLFRSGSIADRARHEQLDDRGGDDPLGDQPPEGGA